jgi:hypothetical protein
MLKIAIASALLLAGATYSELREKALVLERPGSAVAVLVGACDVVDGAVSGECLENTKELKEKVAGKRVVIDLGAGHETMLSFGGRRDGGKTRFVWAPLYDVRNGLALTVGKPTKLSPNGNVVVSKRPIDGTSPDDLMDSDLTRLASTGMLAIELVGKFGKTWSLSGATQTVKGVLFEVEGLRLYNARNGKTVFESTQALK